MAVSTPAKPVAARVSAYRGPYASLINPAARRNGLDPWLLAGLLYVESRFNPKAASSAGAVGIAQIELSAHPNVTPAEAQNPKFAIPWAARFLSGLKRSAGGSTTGALRAYNTGSSQPSSAGNQYATAVLAARKHLRSGGGAGGGQVAPGAYVAPIPGGTVTQLDQGVDYQGPVGGPVLAIGNGRIDAVTPDPGGFGQAIYYTLTSGPKAGQQLYAGEALPNVRPGQQVKAGQRIATLVAKLPGANVTGPGVTEVGLASGSNAPLYTSGSTGGQVFQASFGGLLKRIPTPLNPLAPFEGGLPGIPGVPSPSGIINGVKGAYDTTKAVGDLAAKILTDPGYIALWLGFFALGIVFVFLGIERLLGRSARSDAGGLGKGLAVVAAPEAAPVMVGA